MATRQYIGARYTIKIYENTLDPSSAEWENGFPYEYLTLVTLNRDAYLSRKDVPSSVGSPALNGDYWVKIGDFNGQIANLQSQVDRLYNYVNGGYQTFDGRKFAFACDSWMGVINDALVPMMGLSLTDVIRIGCSGGGFVQQNGDGDTFITKLQAQAVNNDVTDLIVIGGQNDAYGGQSASAVESAMNDYFALARTKYPKAAIYFIPCQHITDTTAHAINYNIILMPAFKSACAANAVKFYDNAPFILNKISLVSGDRQHPSSAGELVLANYILNAIIGGDISVQEMSDVTITTSTINGVVNAYLKTNNNLTILSAAIGNTSGAWEFLTPKTIADLVNVRTALANVADVGGNTVNAWDFREVVPILIVTTTGKYMTDALFELRNGGDITMQLYPDMSAHGTETVQYVQIFKPLDLKGYTSYIA